MTTWLNSFIQDKGITLLYGEASTGKTCCCLLNAVNQVKKGGKVIFLDTEHSFSVERIKQISGNNFDSILKNVFLIPIKSFKTQQVKLKSLDKLISNKEVGLIIIDSITNYYRTLVNSRKELANNMLTSQMKILERIAKNIPVLITGHVYFDINRGSTNPVGEVELFKFSDSIIKLEQNPRRMVMNRPGKKSRKFEIVKLGIE